MGLSNWHWIKLLREWKTRLLLLTFLLLFSSFSTFYQQQNIERPVDEMRSNYEVTQQLFETISEIEFQNEQGKEIYDILARQQHLYGMQTYILSEEDGNIIDGLGIAGSDYLENAREIITNQLLLWEMSDLPSYEIITSTLDDFESLTHELDFYHYLDNYNLDFEWNPQSASQVLQQQVEVIVGILLFVFVALLASDRFTNDQIYNWSVTQGYPVSWKKQWHQRSIQLWILMWITITIGVLVSYGISLIRETSGSLMYPVSVYLLNGMHYIPTWQYLLILLGFGMLLSYTLLLLTTGLSWIFRNVYLTIGLSILIYFIPFVWEIVQPASSFQPSLYLHLVPIVTGESAERFGMNGLNIWKVPLVFILILLILEALFSVIFTFIPTKTQGLKKRETK